MKRKIAIVISGFCGTVMLLFSCMVQVAFADNYPSKPITMICAYSAGGGSDLAARMVAKYTEKYLGQAIVVENRAGAGGQIGFTALSKAKPDGYTIGMFNVPAMNMLSAVRANCPYKTSDFAPLVNAILDPVVLAVGADSKFKTLEDFISFAKSNPEKIILGVDGPQTNAQLQPLIMEKALDIKLKYVFYNGAAPALTAAIGGHTFGTTPGASEAQQYVENGQLRVLAVFSESRFSGLPNVPTFKEVTGLDISYVPSNRGFGTQAGVPEERKKILAEAMRKAIEDPEFQKKATEMGLPVFYEDTVTFTQKIETLEKELENFKEMLVSDK
ncbi:tripartite tricarboxylate transporter substrate binding protein [Cloacibacillus porcorum]|uniref:tripartite tricarboxylate transporter substrate binding protein n=1 Tax=Cloacibacillus porcorum TaxID=1197717 RepID=UPI0023F2E8D2|nr:tripartite tricarboxylate transporter substrate binding protein [Cloacibacillus porcorum]MDD7648188.1 tripartite tricarboxylate transporter substrate binding protein [Cloacibacillus porcorum]MDY4093741.1 tripartite tricarboxylate transporter substrate binding protein [Cloacibacillus porcorum]